MGCIITQLRVSHSWLPKSTTYSSYGGLYPDVYILICIQAFDSALLKLLFSLDNDSLEKRWGRCSKRQICVINNHVFAICSGVQFLNGFNLLEESYGLINFVSSKTHAKTQAPLKTLQGAGSLSNGNNATIQRWALLSSTLVHICRLRWWMIQQEELSTQQRLEAELHSLWTGSGCISVYCSLPSQSPVYH